MKDRFTPVQRLIRMIEKAWLPIPFLHDVEHAVAHALVTNPKLQSNIPIQHIPMDQVKPTQWTLDNKTVTKYAQTGNTSGGLTIKRNGDYFVFDGHHRYAAAKQNKQDYFSTKVIELPNRSLSLGTLARKIGQDPKAITQSMGIDDRRVYESEAL